MARRPTLAPPRLSLNLLRHLAENLPAKLLADVLAARLTLDALPQDVTVRLACSSALDTLLDEALDDDERERLPRRYEEIFRHVVCGLLEDRLDGHRAALPAGIWCGRQGAANGAIITRFVIEDRLGWPLETVPRRISRETFRPLGLSGMMSDVFRGAPWLALEAAYPGRYRPWDFRHAPNSYWQGTAGRQRAIEAVHWLFDEKLRWDADTIRRRCQVRTFYQNGLGGMLATVFRTSVWQAIAAAYPGRYRPWEFKQQDFWTGPDGKEHAVAAIHWLFDEQLGWGDEEIRTRPLFREFGRHGLGGMMLTRYRNSVLDALEEAYPGRFQRWERRVKRAYWQGRRGRERGIAAVRWLIEEKLGWNESQVRALLTRETFAEHELMGMLERVFDGSMQRALQAAYRGRYSPANTVGLYRGVTDSLLPVLVRRLRALEEARRLGVTAASRRAGVTAQTLRNWRRAYEARGVRGLTPRTRGRGAVPIPVFSARRAADALGWEHLDLSAAEAVPLLAERGFTMSVGEVEDVWYATGLLPVKRRLRVLARLADRPPDAAAARELGVTQVTLVKWQRAYHRGGPEALRDGWFQFSAETTWRILAVAVAHPTAGPKALAPHLRAIGLRLPAHAVKPLLKRHRLNTPARRLLAADRLPADLAWLEDVVPRRGAGRTDRALTTAAAPGPRAPGRG